MTIKLFQLLWKMDGGEMENKYSTTALLIQILGMGGSHLHLHLIFFNLPSIIILLVGAHPIMNSYVLNSHANKQALE